MKHKDQQRTIVYLCYCFEDQERKKGFVFIRRFCAQTWFSLLFVYDDVCRSRFSHRKWTSTQILRNVVSLPCHHKKIASHQTFMEPARLSNKGILFLHWPKSIGECQMSHRGFRKAPRDHNSPSGKFLYPSGRQTHSLQSSKVIIWNTRLMAK